MNWSMNEEVGIEIECLLSSAFFFFPGEIEKEKIACVQFFFIHFSPICFPLVRIFIHIRSYFVLLSLLYIFVVIYHSISF